MTVVTLRPNGTAATSGSPTLTGAPTIHAALASNSDSSYVTLEAYTDRVDVALDDLTLPAEAVVKAVAARLRLRAVDGYIGMNVGIDGVYTGGHHVSWSSPTTVTAWSVTSAASDALIDGAVLELEPVYGVGDVAIYAAYVDITYVPKPVVDVIAPTGAVTDTNLPTVSWADTIDTDGGPQARWLLRVFTAAQYGIGGFDPGSSPSTYQASGLDATTSHQVTTPLPDGTYRAYLRVAQVINGTPHYSAFDFIDFTVSVALPGTPVLVAAADNTNGRITLTVTDTSGAAVTNRLELERSLDAGTTWEAVRTRDAGGALHVPHVASVGVLADAVNATTHAVPLPAPAGGILADDLLLAVVAMDGNPTVSWPADWTEIKDEAGNGSAVRAAVAWKRAAGGETGTITITTSASEGGGARILCVRDAGTTSPPEISTGVSAATANANPDALNPAAWGTEPTLWVAAVAVDANVAVTAAPSGYVELGNTRWADATNGAGIATAVRLASVSSEDPAAFTHAAEDTRAFTIAVRPRNPNLTAYDYEAPNGTTVQYRARAVHFYNGQPAASAWATDTEAWASSDYWLKHPNRPELNTRVHPIDMQQQQAARHGVFQPLGARLPIVVSDLRGGPTGSLTLRTDDAAERAALDAILDTVSVLLLQFPPADGEPDRYVKIGDQGRQRLSKLSTFAKRSEPLTWIEVNEPGDVVVAWP